MTSLTVKEIINYDQYLESQKYLLLSNDPLTSNQFEMKIRNYLDQLANKMLLLRDVNNAEYLKLIVKKWHNVLGEMEDATSEQGYYSEITLIPEGVIVPEKVTRYIHKWASQLRELIAHSISEKKLHPDYIQPTSSDDPELAQIIESMYQKE